MAGPSLLGWVDFRDHEAILQLLAELGVLILLFAIGLETDIAQLLEGGSDVDDGRDGGRGVAVRPGLCRLSVCWASATWKAIMAAATLTATSVGITAQGPLRPGPSPRAGGPDHPIGAAVIDDILGLLFLTIVDGLTQGAAALDDDDAR